MIHLLRPEEADLHEPCTTCPCGCEMQINGGGDMVVIHSSFEIDHLLQTAERILKGDRLPDVAHPFQNPRQAKKPFPKAGGA